MSADLNILCFHISQTLSWLILKEIITVKHQPLIYFPTNAVKDIEIRLFADDTALFIHGKDVEMIYNKMKDALIRLRDWFKSNRLTLHLDKTCYSIFHGPRKKIPRMYDNMSIGGHVIHREHKVKYLGLIIDETLSWKDHVDYIITSLSKFYGIFNKIKHFVPKKYK